MRECLRCKTPLDDDTHFNRKRCEPCAILLRRKPIGRLNPIQETEVRRHAGFIPQAQLAEYVGCSRTNLIRWASANRVSLNCFSYKPDVIEKVCKFYEKHGKRKTQDHFPKVSVRSIIERHKLYKPRQIKWTTEQIIEAVKMSGLVSMKAQAKYFNRPGAHVGSIQSLWNKRFGFRGGSINGLVYNHAKHLNTNARYLNPFGMTRNNKKVKFRRLVLWIDLEKNLRPGTPDFIVDAIRTMADFQRWLWRCDDPKPLIVKMMKDREFTRPSHREG